MRRAWLIAVAGACVLAGGSRRADAQAAPNACEVRTAPPAFRGPTTAPAAKATKNASSPLLDARDEAKAAAEAARGGMEGGAIREVMAKAPGRQGGPAAARVRNVLQNGGNGMGMPEFGGLLRRLYVFPEPGAVVRAAKQSGGAKGWLLPQGPSVADIVLARTDPPADGSKLPRISFFVPAAQRDAFAGLTKELTERTPAHVVAETFAAAREKGFAALGAINTAGAPPMSIALDASADFAAMIAEQKKDAIETIAASAYTAALQKEKFGLLGRPKGTRERIGVGRNIAAKKATEGLVSSYGRPNNPTVHNVANVAGAAVLSEVANQNDLSGAIAQLGEAGAGSDLGIVLDPATSAAQRRAFASGDGIGVRMTLADGTAVPLTGATGDELAQVVAFTMTHPEANAGAITARFDALRSARK